MEAFDPWKNYAANHRRGETVRAPVFKIIRDLGLFVDLGQDIFGIVHLKDLSWDVPGEQAIEDYSVGDQIQAVILSTDVDRQRVSLGIKQTKPKPGGSSGWDRRPPNSRRRPPKPGPDLSDTPMGPAPKPSPSAGEVKVED